MWPKHKPHDPSKVSYEEDVLFDAVTNCLKEAIRLGVTSIAIPAISSGVYGFPIDLCAKTIVEACVEFSEQNQSSLREVKFIDVTVQHSVAFQKALQVACSDVRDGMPGSK